MPARSPEELTGRHPASVEVSAATVRDELPPDRTLVVLDDDPTGTQSVADLPVLTDGTLEALTWALQQGAPAVYVLTNSRSLDPDEAERINVRVARAAFEAAATTGRTIDLVSRSDSTLRGHFPLEPLVLADEARTAGQRVDGVVVVPAFPDAGRITVDGTHYAGSPEAGYTPVGETEYARDATFGYTSSHLPDWVAERAAGTDLRPRRRTSTSRPCAPTPTRRPRSSAGPGTHSRSCATSSTSPTCGGWPWPSGRPSVPAAASSTAWARRSSGR